MTRRAIIALAVFFCAVSAYAQTREDWRQSENGPPTVQEPSDKYEGVTPGSGNTLPSVATLKDKPGVWVTWPGFTTQATGGTRLFLQTTSDLKYKIVEQTSGKITVDLGKISVHLGNNRNPLVTTHFNTPLKRAYLKKVKKRFQLIMELKVTATPEISQSTNADGYSYFFVDFPPGTYPQQP